MENNEEKELLKSLSVFLKKYHKREEGKEKMMRLSLLLKFSFFFIVALAFVTFYLPFVNKLYTMGEPNKIPENSIPVIKIDKPIGNSEDMINSTQFNSMLKAAYRDGKTKGVILHMNSPGGSPVESDIIYERINHYKNKYPHIKIISVVQDMCASGCYYIASATDKIYANETSMVGSIGVIMSSFGFEDAIEKLGIERRVYTAGESKSFLDPFKSINEESEEHIKGILNSAHDVFKERVIEGRGDKLKVDEYDDIFTGLIWVNEDLKNRGLIDDFGNIYEVSSSEYGEDEFFFINARERINIMDILNIKVNASLEGLKSSIEGENRTIKYQ